MSNISTSLYSSPLTLKLHLDKCLNYSWKTHTHWSHLTHLPFIQKHSPEITDHFIHHTLLSTKRVMFGFRSELICIFLLYVLFHQDVPLRLDVRVTTTFIGRKDEPCSGFPSNTWRGFLNQLKNIWARSPLAMGQEMTSPPPHADLNNSVTLLSVADGTCESMRIYRHPGPLNLSWWKYVSIKPTNWNSVSGWLHNPHLDLTIRLMFIDRTKSVYLCIII